MVPSLNSTQMPPTTVIVTPVAYAPLIRIGGSTKFGGAPDGFTARGILVGSSCADMIVLF